MQMIYLGNMNSGYATTIDNLTPLLRTLTSVTAASPFKNKMLRLLDMVRAVLKAKPSDVVLIDTYSTLAFYYAWLCGNICRWRGIKYIPYLHGGNLPQRIDRNKKWLNAYFTHASLIVTPSAYLKEAVERRGYKRVRFIYNFIRLQNYPYKVRNKVSPRLLWVRSFHHLYNPEMAIRVLAELRKDFGDAKLCMVGPDKDGSAEKCKDLAHTLGVADCIEFTGKLTRDGWIALSADYDLFINTTNYDNMPVSVIEAMAVGMAIVSTNAGGIPYLIRDEEDGLLVQKDDHLSMAERVKELVQDSAKAKHISAAARKKAEAFDWNCIKHSWLELIREYA
jgi:glycosyltransferase involved in cell wall biosynthesis